jgi:hypothetical protein
MPPPDKSLNAVNNCPIPLYRRAIHFRLKALPPGAIFAAIFETDSNRPGARVL